MAAVLFLFSCSNDPAKVKKVSTTEDLPMEVTEDMALTYSDSGAIRLRLNAPLSEYYPQLKEPERRFPQGIDVKFLDSFGNEESRLRADHAVQYISKNLWEATGNVVVVNKKGEQLNTEKLYWDQSKEEIYSDKFVKISTDKEVIMGEGFEADQNFSNYEIHQVTGQIQIEEDEENAKGG
ncbi:MAG: LPS export ABC transporter periplasmic protein LptC [Owenweeksia sp.]|nr:LPS export ABC transporter periplasmic protein LptC [Owenweeksia sp.]